MSKTRILDATLATLRNDGTAKRAPRKAQVNIALYDLGTVGVSVQVNGREVWLAPNMQRAEDDAASRKNRAEALGRTVNIERF